MSWFRAWSADGYRVTHERVAIFSLRYRGSTGPTGDFSLPVLVTEVRGESRVARPTTAGRRDQGGAGFRLGAHTEESPKTVESVYAILWRKSRKPVSAFRYKLEVRK